LKPSSSTHLIQKNLIKKNNPSLQIPTVLQNPTKTQKEKSQISTSNPPTITTIKKNQQPNRFPNENPKLSTPTETKNKPKKRNPRENRKATTTEFEKGEAWESN
jgi:hypothetical protein